MKPLTSMEDQHCPDTNLRLAQAGSFYIAKLIGFGEVPCRFCRLTHCLVCVTSGVIGMAILRVDADCFVVVLDGPLVLT